MEPKLRNSDLDIVQMPNFDESYLAFEKATTSKVSAGERTRTRGWEGDPKTSKLRKLQNSKTPKNPETPKTMLQLLEWVGRREGDGDLREKKGKKCARRSEAGPKDYQGIHERP
jgi:hypothetical protein